MREDKRTIEIFDMCRANLVLVQKFREPEAFDDEDDVTLMDENTFHDISVLTEHEMKTPVSVGKRKRLPNKFIDAEDILEEAIRMHVDDLDPIIKALTFDKRNLVRILARYRKTDTILDLCEKSENSSELFGLALSVLFENEAISDALKLVVKNEAMITRETKVVDMVMDSFERSMVVECTTVPGIKFFEEKLFLLELLFYQFNEERVKRFLRIVKIWLNFDQRGEEAVKHSLGPIQV